MPADGLVDQGMPAAGTDGLGLLRVAALRVSLS
jgi:hypothetical protein